MIIFSLIFMFFLLYLVKKNILLARDISYLLYFASSWFYSLACYCLLVMIFAFPLSGFIQLAIFLFLFFVAHLNYLRLIFTGAGFNDFLCKILRVLIHISIILCVINFYVVCISYFAMGLIFSISFVSRLIFLLSIVFSLVTFFTVEVLYIKECWNLIFNNKFLCLVKQDSENT